MKQVVLIPWYGVDELRQRNLRLVGRHLSECGFVVAPIDTIEGARSPGAARNYAVEVVADSDVVVFNDADSLVACEQVERAVRLASLAPGLVFAYDLYVRLSERASAALDDEWTFDELLAEEHDEVMHASGSMGCVAIRRECFDELDGFDEDYVGWGYEDLDFARRACAHWPLRRVPGPLFHLWHGGRRDDDSPLDSDAKLARANEERYRWSFAPS